MSLNPMRRQLPVLSPLPARALAAATRALGGAPDAAPELADLLRRDYGADEVVLTASGTQALQLALARAARRAGTDRVAVPAFTCYDVASAVVGAGVHAVLYDVDADTLQPVPASVAAALDDGAGAVLVAPLYGVPIDWIRLEAALGARRPVVVEDAAQGHGALHHGLRLGSRGDLAVLSFGRGKGWTGARGGALLSRGADAEPGPVLPAPPGARRGTLLRAAAQAALARPAVYGLPSSLPFLHLGETVYHSPAPVTAMDDVAAATVLATRAASEAEIAVRLEAGDDFAARVPGGFAHAVPADSRAGWLRYPLRVADAAAFLRRFDSLGVAPSYPLPLHRLPELRQHSTAAGPLPGAETLARELVTLPTHSLAVRERPTLMRHIDATLRR